MRRLKRIAISALAALLVLSLAPAGVFAAGGSEKQEVSIDYETWSGQAEKNDTLYLSLTVKGKNETPYKVFLNTDRDVSVLSGNSGVIESSDEAKITYKLKTLKDSRLGKHNITVYATDPVDTNLVYGKKAFELVITGDGNQVVTNMNGMAVDLEYSVEGGDTIVAGAPVNFKLFVYNRSTGPIKSAVLSLGLPDGISIRSGSNEVNIGTINKGSAAEVNFDIVADAGIPARSYPFQITLSAEVREATSVTEYPDGSGGYSALTQYAYTKKESTKSLYIPVSSVGSGDYEIANITLPSDIKANEDFTFGFTVKNTGSSAANDLIAEVSLPEGVNNTSKNVFTIKKLEGGAEESFNVNCKAGSGGGSKMFTVTVRPAMGGGAGISDYAVATFSAAGGGGVNPIVMVSDYSYGGKDVASGSEFDLSLTFKNTSPSQVKNIKATVSSAGEAFIPVGSSSSLYIASIPAGGAVTKKVHMSCRQDAGEGPVSVTVSTAYEGESGGSYSGSDIISVPVMQVIRLVVDDILEPGYLTAADMAYVNVNYYNMGRSEIRNLRISVSGDFTVDGEPSSYMGNMSPGKSDYFSFNFYPNGEGECKGTVTFTYENAMGEEQVYEKNFVFHVDPAPEMDPGMQGDMPEPPVETGGLSKKVKLAIAGGVLVVGAVAARKLIKRHKKKKEEELDLNE